jgi:membrane protein DedA with SNARE-associated domain
MEQTIIHWLNEAAGHPSILYSVVILVLTASSFGLPIPEEVVLVTSGLIAHFAIAQSLQSGLPPSIDPENLAAICLVAVLGSDLVVFWLGRRYGLGLLRRRPFNRFLSENALARAQKWTGKYGFWACGLFRFTPAVRFPGHFMCGAMKISYQKFLLADGPAAILTVPTQVLLLAYHGDKILAVFKQFKIYLFSGLGILFLIWLLLRWKKGANKTESENQPERVA